MTAESLHRRTGRGMALVLGLLLLAALSLLAVMAANGMLLQRRMAANFEDRERALANAQLATAAARAWLYSRPDVDREAGCESGCLLPPAVHAPGELPLDPEYRGAAWWRLNGIPAGVHPETGNAYGVGAGDSALWLLEEVHYESFEPPVEGPSFGGIGFYRVFGRGDGSLSGSVAITESILARPWEGTHEPAAYPPEPAGTDFCRQFGPNVPCGTLSWRLRR